MSSRFSLFCWGLWGGKRGREVDVVLHSLLACLVCISMLLFCLSSLSFSFIFFVFSISLGKGSLTEVERRLLLLIHDPILHFFPPEEVRGLLEGGEACLQTLSEPFTSSDVVEKLLCHIAHLPLFSLSSPSFVWQSEFLLVSTKQVEVHRPVSSHHCLVAFPRFDPALAWRPLDPPARPAIPEQAGGAALPGVEGFC